jgi:hypothetical protein
MPTLKTALALLLAALLLLARPAAAESISVLVQSSPLAGSQYYALADSWPQMQVGDRLTLIREADNRHDRNAVRVEWRGRKLGYVPRAENRAVAAALDAGEALQARIATLRDEANPWHRLEFEVFLVL